MQAAGGRTLVISASSSTSMPAGGAENVVVTGGEPLEHPAFVPLIAGLKALGRRVEIETAGTEEPPAVSVDQWNVSLKLAHSGVPESRRLRGDAITRFRDLGAWFKFVVAEERDVAEVLAIQARFALPSARIVLMPLGMRREEQEARMPAVVEWCRRHGFRFSPRLHILLWGPRRGV
jgi:organic radical activating enzyme